MAFKILVAEDEDITLKHLLNVLSKEGYETVGVQNGDEALKIVESDHIDLLFGYILL